jgi:hypothetical protein
MKPHIVEVSYPHMEGQDFKSVAKMFKSTFRKYKKPFGFGIIIQETSEAGYECHFMGKIPEHETSCLEALGYEIDQDYENLEGIENLRFISATILFSIPKVVSIFNHFREDSSFQATRL